MKTTILNARTVTIVRDLKVEKRKGANGEFESKDILFRIAVDRDYKVTRQENGKTISERPTDFWLAKATGNVAQVFADYCTATKEDGKLISRHLLLSGNFENYQNTRNVKTRIQRQVEINGQVYQLDFEAEVPVENNTNTIFVIDSLEFLDSNPIQSSTPNNTPVVTATPVQNITPVQPQGTTPVVTATPVQNITPVQPQGTTSNQSAQAPMNPPVVGADFNGQTAPF